MSLKRLYNNITSDISNQYEICIDEAGRGCLFGRVYIACVVLPKEPESFASDGIKDSKKFSSKKKIMEAAEYIKTHAYAWHIAFVDETVIDEINILQAVMRGMHECIRITFDKLKIKVPVTTLTDCMAIIDGNYFKPYRTFDTNTETIIEMPYATIERGDSLYLGIAAASILAKTARDNYVLEMCKLHPDLSTRYGLHKNMGYGTKEHLQGIREHAITQWHRRTFGICRNSEIHEIVLS